MIRRKRILESESDAYAARPRVPILAIHAVGLWTIGYGACAFCTGALLGGAIRPKLTSLCIRKIGRALANSIRRDLYNICDGSASERLFTPLQRKTYTIACLREGPFVGHEVGCMRDGTECDIDKAFSGT